MPKMNLDMNPFARPGQQQFQGGMRKGDSFWSTPAESRRPAPIAVQPVKPKPAAPPKVAKAVKVPAPAKAKEINAFQQGKRGPRQGY